MLIDEINRQKILIQIAIDGLLKASLYYQRDDVNGTAGEICKDTLKEAGFDVSWLENTTDDDREIAIKDRIFEIQNWRNK